MPHKTYRVAAVAFLNTAPLVEGLEDLPRQVAVTYDLPSHLAELLYADLADAALLPVVEIFRGQSGGMVPGIGIAARGPVASVKVFSRVPLAEIRQVFVDRASRTSVALLRILLAELHGIRPDFFAGEPRPADLMRGQEAILVIGDRCFAYDRQVAGNDEFAFQAHDLAEMWVEMTGLPFVFATWALSKSFAARATPAERRELIQLLTHARDRGLARLEMIAEREAAAGRLGPGGESSAAALRMYFRKCLQYVLSDKEMAGLQRFHELCLQHAVIPTGLASPIAAAGKGE